MPCPYAEEIKGTIAKCRLLNKKVSTMRYPCTGNYKRCPVYIRMGGEAAGAPPVEREAPPLQVESVEAPAKPPEARAEAPPTPPPTPAMPAEPVVSGEVKGVQARVFEASRSLCDSLILASLTVSSRAVGIYRGPLRDAAEKLKGHLEAGSILFIVGDYEGYRVRLLYGGQTARYSFEKGGVAVCGEEAKRILEELGLEATLDGIVYAVRLSEIPLWRDQILGELK